jgi:hypothetical protein
MALDGRYRIHNAINPAPYRTAHAAIFEAC